MKLFITWHVAILRSTIFECQVLLKVKINLNLKMNYDSAKICYIFV
jgi:hypothetical protein